MRVDSGVPAGMRKGQRASVPHRCQLRVRVGTDRPGVRSPPPSRRRRGDRTRPDYVEAQAGGNATA